MMNHFTNTCLERLNERGFIQQCSDPAGLSQLMDAGPITFYVGCDPTGPSLHIGHMVPFFAFRHLVAAGHQGIALIGGGTARIGDPSGKTALRRMLTYDQLDANAAAITAQLDRFLHFDGAQARPANNKDWLANLNYIDFLREIGSHFSVNRMLSFEAYRLRMETGLSFIEFNYQLLQSYDFLQLYRRHQCRLQIGGDDQWGNIVAGIDLIRRIHGAQTNDAQTTSIHGDAQTSGAPCFALTFPLVTTSDGKKMGKTEKGALFLDPAITPPYEFFQYWRNVPDADAGRFLRMFTFLPLEECAALTAPGRNPNDAKERLAWEVTALIHGAAAADQALAGAAAAFGGGGDKRALPRITLPCARFDAGYNVVDLFVDAGLAPTKSEARRLVQQGGAFVGATTAVTPVSDVAATIGTDQLSLDRDLVLRAGKKRYCLVEVHV